MVVIIMSLKRSFDFYHIRRCFASFAIHGETTILGDPDEAYVLTTPATLPNKVLNLSNLTVSGKFKTTANLTATNVTFQNDVTLGEGNTTFYVTGGTVNGNIIIKKASAKAKIENATLNGNIDGETSKGGVELENVNASDLNVTNTRNISVSGGVFGNLTLAPNAGYDVNVENAKTTSLTVTAKNISITNTSVDRAFNAYASEDLTVTNTLNKQKASAKNYSHLKAGNDLTLINTTFTNETSNYVYLVAGKNLKISGGDEDDFDIVAGAPASDSVTPVALMAVTATPVALVSEQSYIKGIVYMNAGERILAKTTRFGNLTYVNVVSSTAGDKEWLSDNKVEPEENNEVAFEACKIDAQVATRSKTTFAKSNFAREGTGTGNKANGIRVLATDADKNEEDEVTTYDWIIVANCIYGSNEENEIKVSNFKSSVWPFTISVDGIDKAGVKLNEQPLTTIEKLQNEW